MFGSLVHSSLLLLGLPSVYGAALQLPKRPVRDVFSIDAVTSHYAPIVKSTKPSKSNGILSKKAGRATTPSAPLSALGGQEYLVSIEWAGSSYTVIVDSGSSDTWLIQSGFECLDANGNEQSASNCNFGSPFTGTFDDGSISNENFNITYGDGEFVTGVMGYEDVTIAGITVTKQEVALGTKAYWTGDGTSSGLMGLAYEALTSAFGGTTPADDNQQEPYSPLFQTMVSEGLSSGSFSLALERGSGGYIAFGGLPPVSGVSSSNLVSTPIQYLNSFSSSEYTFYAITASLKYGSTKSSSTQYIVDSGTTLLYAPSSVAKAVNKAFKPSAKYESSQGAYFVECSATPPALSVTIAGTSFTVNPVDLIYQDQVDPNTGLCLTGVQDGGQGPYILGDVFLQNVVAVFDVANTEMRFAAHETY